MSEKSVNLKNTAVKRIMADVRELERHKTSRYYAVPLEDNMFEWHFTIRGPVGTDFEGGIYHGRILLPADYPFKPPNIIFLTKNGRFEVGTKICLSISAYHPEHWQPAWGVRTMLEAIISFLPTEGAGAIGALDWTPEERKRLAKESHSYTCPLCGNPVHQLPARNVDSERVDEAQEDKPDAEMKSQIAQLHLFGLGPVSTKESPAKCAPSESNPSLEPNSPDRPSLETAVPPATPLRNVSSSDVSSERPAENVHLPVIDRADTPSIRQVRRRILSNRHHNQHDTDADQNNEVQPEQLLTDNPTSSRPEIRTPNPPPPAAAAATATAGAVRIQGRDFVDEGLVSLLFILALAIALIFCRVCLRLMDETLLRKLTGFL